MYRNRQDWRSSPRAQLAHVFCAREYHVLGAAVRVALVLLLCPGYTGLTGFARFTWNAARADPPRSAAPCPRCCCRRPARPATSWQWLRGPCSPGADPRWHPARVHYRGHPQRHCSADAAEYWHVARHGRPSVSVCATRTRSFAHAWRAPVVKSRQGCRRRCIGVRSVIILHAAVAVLRLASDIRRMPLLRKCSAIACWASSSSDDAVLRRMPDACEVPPWRMAPQPRGQQHAGLLRHLSIFNLLHGSYDAVQTGFGTTMHS